MILLFLLFILALDARADYNETIDDHDGRIQPNGRWLRQSVAAGDNYPYLAWNTNNSSSHTEIAGVSASLDFKGSAIFIEGIVRVAGANFTVRLDGQTENGSSTGAPIEHPVILWSKRGLDPNIMHNVTITKTSNHPTFIGDSPQGLSWLSLDTFYVTHPGEQPSSIPTSTQSPPRTPTGSDPNKPSPLPSPSGNTPPKNPDLQSGTLPAIIAGTLGGIAIIAFGIFLAIFVTRRRKTRYAPVVNRKSWMSIIGTPVDEARVAINPTIDPFILDGNMSEQPPDYQSNSGAVAETSSLRHEVHELRKEIERLVKLQREEVMRLKVTSPPAHDKT